MSAQAAGSLEKRHEATALRSDASSVQDDSPGPVAQVLAGAYDLLADLKLCRDSYYRFDADGELVAVDIQGALLEVTPRGWRRDLVWEGAIPLLREVIGRPDVAAWSDAPERSKAEVLDVLRRAAESARS